MKFSIFFKISRVFILFLPFFSQGMNPLKPCATSFFLNSPGQGDIGFEIPCPLLVPLSEFYSVCTVDKEGIHYEKVFNKEKTLELKSMDPILLQQKKDQLAQAFANLFTSAISMDFIDVSDLERVVISWFDNVPCTIEPTEQNFFWGTEKITLKCDSVEYPLMVPHIPSEKMMLGKEKLLRIYDVKSNFNLLENTDYRKITIEFIRRIFAGGLSKMKKPNSEFYLSLDTWVQAIEMILESERNQKAELDKQSNVLTVIKNSETIAAALEFENQDLELEPVAQPIQAIKKSEDTKKLSDQKINNNGFWYKHKSLISSAFGVGIGFATGLGIKTLLEKYTDINQKYMFPLIGTTMVLGGLMSYFNAKTKK